MNGQVFAGGVCNPVGGHFGGRVHEMEEIARLTAARIAAAPHSQTAPDAEALQSEVRREVEDLHRFFVGWMTGALPKDAFETQFLSRLAPDFRMVTPRGVLLNLDQLQTSLRRTRATNPDMRIAIRNVRVHTVSPSHVLATYEEWQHHAMAPSPSQNARIASVVFERTGGLRWLQVHETWLPESVVLAGPYDF